MLQEGQKSSSLNQHKSLQKCGRGTLVWPAELWKSLWWNDDAVQLFAFIIRGMSGVGKKRPAWRQAKGSSVSLFRCVTASGNGKPCKFPHG